MSRKNRRKKPREVESKANPIIHLKYLTGNKAVCEVIEPTTRSPIWSKEFLSVVPLEEMMNEGRKALKILNRQALAS